MMDKGQDTSDLNEYKFQQKSKIQIQHNDFTKFPVHSFENPVFWKKSSEHSM